MENIIKAKEVNIFLVKDSKRVVIKGSRYYQKVWNRTVDTNLAYDKLIEKEFVDGDNVISAKKFYKLVEKMPSRVKSIFKAIKKAIEENGTETSVEGYRSTVKDRRAIKQMLINKGVVELQEDERLVLSKDDESSLKINVSIKTIEDGEEEVFLG